MRDGGKANLSTQMFWIGRDDVHALCPLVALSGPTQSARGCQLLTQLRRRRCLTSPLSLRLRCRQRFLEYIVTEALAGRGDRLKGYNIGLEVFDRPETFDPVIDPLVRTEAARLREALSKQMDAAQMAVKLDPNDGKAHLALGEAYSFHGKSEQAFAEFDRAETLAPSDADLLLSIAWAISYFDETARAVSLAERSLTLNPHYPDWYNQGLSTVFFFGEQY